jgi:membrane protein
VGAAGRVKERLRVARSRWPWLDHTVRAYDRNSEVLGNRLAAATTYFGFLSFFPLLALAFALVGYLSDFYPSVQDEVTKAIEEAFPNLIGPEPGQIDLQDVIDAKTSAGIIGLVGLLYAGLGWLDALRDSLRRVYGVEDIKIGWVKKKLVDVLVLALLGLSFLVSLVVSSLATSATTYSLDLVGLEDSAVASVLLKLLSVALALALDVVIFAILLSRLSGARLPWKQVRSGAVLAAVGFEVLKLGATFLLGRTTDNPLYATFGVIVGLLVWIYLNSQLLMFAAAWTATRPYSLEPAPAGDVGAGRSTGLAAATEPVTPVAPADYERVPVAADAAGDPSSGSRWRGALVGAGIGAAVAAVASRRKSRD